MPKRGRWDVLTTPEGEIKLAIPTTTTPVTALLEPSDAASLIASLVGALGQLAETKRG